MLFIIQQVITFLKLLHAESSDKKIALAAMLGFFSAVSPVLSLQGVLLLLMALLLRVQFGAFMFSWLLFSLALVPFAQIFDQIGYVLLSSEGLREFYVWAQQSAVLSQTRFNNTIILGGFVAAVVLAIPLFFIVRFILKKYRETVVSRVKKSKFYHMLKASVLFKVVEFYEKYKTV